MEIELVLETLREISLSRTRTICALIDFYLIQLKNDCLHLESSFNYLYNEITIILSEMNAIPELEEDVIIRMLDNLLYYIKSLDRETLNSHFNLIK